MGEGTGLVGFHTVGLAVIFSEPPPPSKRDTRFLNVSDQFVSDARFAFELVI